MKRFGIYSLVDIRDLQNVVDWYPEDHPPMPDIVKHAAAGDTAPIPESPTRTR